MRTTPEYVWKVKSKARKEGMLSHQEIELSKTREEAAGVKGPTINGSQRVETSAWNQKGYFSVEVLDQEAIKTIYQEFMKGLQPTDIIAKY